MRSWRIWRVDPSMVAAASHAVLIFLVAFGMPLSLERVAAIQGLNAVFILIHAIMRPHKGDKK